MSWLDKKYCIIDVIKINKESVPCQTYTNDKMSIVVRNYGKRI